MFQMFSLCPLLFKRFVHHTSTNFAHQHTHSSTLSSFSLFLDIPRWWLFITFTFKNDFPPQFTFHHFPFSKMIFPHRSLFITHYLKGFSHTGDFSSSPSSSRSHCLHHITCLAGSGVNEKYKIESPSLNLNLSFEGFSLDLPPSCRHPPKQPEGGGDGSQHPQQQRPGGGGLQV